jgi:hypothetical protein
LKQGTQAFRPIQLDKRPESAKSLNFPQLVRP